MTYYVFENNQPWFKPVIELRADNITIAKAMLKLDHPHLSSDRYTVTSFAHHSTGTRQGRPRVIKQKTITRIQALFAQVKKLQETADQMTRERNELQNKLNYFEKIVRDHATGAANG